MAKRTRKLWVGIGVATIAGAAATGDLGAQDPDRKTHAQPPPEQKGGAAARPGEGGEAYLTDGGPRDTRIRFYRDIALMRGHLLVGQELIALDLWDEALPHFLHPTEELYGLMEKYIKLHNMQPFKRELAALAQAVKAKRKGAQEQALKVVEQPARCGPRRRQEVHDAGAQLHRQVGDRGAAHGPVRVPGLDGGRQVHEAGRVPGQPGLRVAGGAHDRGRSG